MIVYGSMLCPDCVACKASFDANNVAYEFVDIMQSIPEMKKFLKLRDENPVFHDAKAAGNIGIPTLVDGEIITLDWEEWLTQRGMQAQAGQACGLDGKGC